MGAQELRASIHAAFESVPHPGYDRVVTHDCEECDEVRRDFGSTTWDRISPAIIDANYDKLPLLSPEGFRHFLPSFLMRALDDPNSNVREYTILGLFSSQTDWYARRIQPLSLREVQVVIDFLNFVLEDAVWPDVEDIRRALNLWNNSFPP
jgi:uncharacterized protein DUF6714